MNWKQFRACSKSICSFDYGSFWLRLRWIFRQKYPILSTKSALSRSKTTHNHSKNIDYEQAL